MIQRLVSGWVSESTHYCYARCHKRQQLVSLVLVLLCSFGCYSFFRFSMIAKWLPETILQETSLIRANCFHKPDWGHIYNFGVFCALFGYFRELFLCGSPYLVFTVWAYVKNAIKHQFFSEVLHILCNFDLLVVKCVISAFDAGS